MLMRATTVAASLAGLVLCFIACFILLVIAPLFIILGSAETKNSWYTRRCEVGYMYAWKL